METRDVFLSVNTHERRPSEACCSAQTRPPDSHASYINTTAAFPSPPPPRARNRASRGSDPQREHASRRDESPLTCRETKRLLFCISFLILCHFRGRSLFICVISPLCSRFPFRAFALHLRFRQWCKTQDMKCFYFAFFFYIFITNCTISINVNAFLWVRLTVCK